MDSEQKKKKQEKALLSLLELWLYSEAILPIWRTKADKAHAVVDCNRQQSWSDIV